MKGNENVRSEREWLRLREEDEVRKRDVKKVRFLDKLTT